MKADHLAEYVRGLRQEFNNEVEEAVITTYGFNEKSIHFLLSRDLSPEEDALIPQEFDGKKIILNVACGPK